jgi:hypothetical protein
MDSRSIPSAKEGCDAPKTVEEKAHLLRKENEVKNGKVIDFEQVLFRF